MDISVIIVSWNVKSLLEKCLESIFRHASPSSPQPSPRAGEGVLFEVTVVDNASTDGTIEMVREKFPQVRFIANAKNKGFASANNQGIKIASGKYILLLNPDTELTENSLKKVFDKMEQNHPLAPSLVKEGGLIGVLGCKLLNSDGTLQPSIRRFPRVADIIIIFFKLHKLFPGLLGRYLAKDFDYTRESAVDQVMGAFICIRRSVIDKIGMLDGGYFIWFEEVDFCRRVRRAGFKVAYWPATSIIHHGGQSFGQVETLRKQWWFFKSAWRYLTK